MKDISQSYYKIPIDVLLKSAIKEYLDNSKLQSNKHRKVSLIKKIWNERVINRLYDKLIDDLKPYKSSLQNELNSTTGLSSPAMEEVISSCTLMMIMDAVGRNPDLISHKLYNELESYSKFRLSFYKEFEEKIKSLAKSFNITTY